MTRADSILICGVGGGGCVMLKSLLEGWPDAPSAVAVHTDAAVLKACGLPASVLLGGTVRMGVGMGGDPARGRAVAERSTDELRKLMSGREIVILMATLGKGTGTGAAPLLAKLARESGALTLVFCTLPLTSEGNAAWKHAAEGLESLRDAADAVVVFQNQRMAQWVGAQATLSETFDRINQIVGQHIRALWNMLTRPSILRVSLSDVRAMVQGCGSLVIACGEGSGENRAGKAVDQLLESPLLENNGAILSRAHGVIAGVVGGPDLRVNELDIISHRIKSSSGKAKNFMLGSATSADYQGRIVITMLVTEDGGGNTAPLPAKTGGSVAAVDDKKTDVKKTRKPVPKPGDKIGLFDADGVNTTSPSRFSGTETTEVDGTNLDVPTYIRRQIRLDS